MVNYVSEQSPSLGVRSFLQRSPQNSPEYDDYYSLRNDYAWSEVSKELVNRSFGFISLRSVNQLEFLSRGRASSINSGSWAGRVVEYHEDEIKCNEHFVPDREEHVGSDKQIQVATEKGHDP